MYLMVDVVTNHMGYLGSRVDAINNVGVFTPFNKVLLPSSPLPPPFSSLFQFLGYGFGLIMYKGILLPHPRLRNRLRQRN